MNERIENLTAPMLAERFGASERWWQRRLAELHDTGTIGKRGRLFFGSVRVVEEWLMSDASTSGYGEFDDGDELADECGCDDGAGASQLQLR